MVAELIRSSILFAIDGEVLESVVKDGESAEVGIPPMPPLPFPRISIQASSGGLVQGLTDIDPSLYEHDVVSADVLLLVVKEITAGVEWLVTPVSAVKNSEGAYLSGLSLDMFSLYADGMKMLIGSRVDQRVQWSASTHSHFAHFARIAVEAVHLITARGSRIEQAESDRALRRRVDKNATALPERVYWVEVRDQAMSDYSGADTTKSSRSYSCRWLVRGHWRWLATDRRTWVSAYIKGPVGGPWRGRPVYHLAP